MSVGSQIGRSRVIVVDDHEAVRAGLERVIERAADLDLVAALSDARDLARVARETRVEVIVADFAMGPRDGLTACLDVKQSRQPPRVAIYSAYAGPSLDLVAAVAQADAVVDKAQPVEALLDAVRRLVDGARLLAPPEPDLLQAAAQRIEPEDQPIMALLLGGASIRDIADTFQASPREAKRRAHRVIGRLIAGAASPRHGSHEASAHSKMQRALHGSAGPPGGG